VSQVFCAQLKIAGSNGSAAHALLSKLGEADGEGLSASEDW
jgi:hypothetical protein